MLFGDALQGELHWVHAQGVLRQHVLLSRVLRRGFSEGLWIRQEKRARSPVLPFLAFLENSKENHQKTRIFYPYRTRKSLGKRGKTLKKNKEFLAEQKNKEFQKNKERKDREITLVIKMITCNYFCFRELIF